MPISTPVTSFEKIVSDITELQNLIIQLSSLLKEYTENIYDHMTGEKSAAAKRDATIHFHAKVLEQKILAAQRIAQVDSNYRGVLGY